MLPWLNSCLVLVDAFLRVLKNDMYIYFFFGGGGGWEGRFAFTTRMRINPLTYCSVILISHTHVKSITRKSLKQ